MGGEIASPWEWYELYVTQKCVGAFLCEGWQSDWPAATSRPLQPPRAAVDAGAWLGLARPPAAADYVSVPIGQSLHACSSIGPSIAPAAHLACIDIVSTSRPASYR